MGNTPSESNMGDRLRCCKCDKVLPPCKSFSDLYQSTVNGRHVYVFNGGEYYRPVGCHNMYECEYCFNKPIRDQEERRREEERQRREAEEKRRQEELNQRLKESHQRAKEQHEKQLSSVISEEYESKRDVLISHLDEFEAHYESDKDELLEILSLKSSIPVSNLRVAQLTADELGEILSVLNKLLFDEWMSAPPSLSTLQHTQVFITELCALSLEIPEELSLQNISNHVQSLVDSISLSASNVFESFLLTQALYLNVMHFLSDHDSSNTDAVIIAKTWAENELPAEKLFLIEFLSTLSSSLQNAVGRASVFILKMEIQCLKLLLSSLTHLNDTETHSESTEMLLRLVQTNQWTPTEALTLLKELSPDVSMSKVLRLVHVYDISPEWMDESGLSLIQAVNAAGLGRFHLDFQDTLRRRDEGSLDAVVAEIKKLLNLNDHKIEMIKNIITGVLQYSKSTPKEAPFIRNSFKCETLNADNIQNSLSQLCKAVFVNKGWWPTVRQMVQWCVLMLPERSEGVQLVSVEEDPCVTAMFAATQVCMGNKVGLVLSSDVHSQEQTMEWSDFYKNLGISLNTNMKKTNASWGTPIPQLGEPHVLRQTPLQRPSPGYLAALTARIKAQMSKKIFKREKKKTDASYKDVHEADIVYGTISDFISDYFQYGRQVLETGSPRISRRFIIENTEEQSLSSSYDVELLALEDNDCLVFAAEVLQSLMGKFHGEDKELRHRFIKALFQVLHINRSYPNTETKIITILEKMNGQKLSSDEVFILTFLENLLKVFTEETENETHKTSPAGSWCLDKLFACAGKFQASTTTKEVLQVVSSLVAQRLWSPAEALNLLGALTNHHHDKDCTSIMNILHLMATYQVSTKWTDENQQSLLMLLYSSRTENLIQNLEKSLRDEKMKSIDTLIDEIRQMGDIDEETLRKTHSVVTHVTNLIKIGEMKNYTDVKRARNLSHSTEEKDLQEVLAVLCYAVNLNRAERKWWPRASQMISWCLLALSDTGKLLEMGTGEGKSCVIAMFAVLRVLRGEKVDVVSSSSVLCQRDAQEWSKFYNYFGVTVDTNTNKTEDKDRKECYQKDVVYGTIEAFAADHLRQTFEMEDVRPDRSYQCIIIDEVDSLLLDQGVQLTYLSSPMVSMQHLNIILAMIWGHVSQYSFLSAEHQTFVQGPPASFFKAIFDSIDTEETEIKDPMDILRIAEESNTVPEGFTEEIYKSEKDEKDELLNKLKTVSQDAVVNFFQELEDYIPYGFTVYTLDDKGFLHLRKRSPYNNPDIPDLKFLVLEEGMCCPLYDSEEILVKPIAELISEKIQYTPCTNSEGKISIPGFLKNLVEKKVSVWVQNAFLALQLKEGREYVVENDNVCPVDFRSTGIVELNKKWGDGLQQFVEIKHQIKLSTISVVTNYISNISFFEKYSGKIYGATGTLGSKTDMLFLQDLYPTLSACKIPTFNRKKLYEVKGSLTTSTEEWKSEIKRAVVDQISPNSYRGGRAALVICETINKAKELFDELKSITRGKVIPYYRSDPHSLSKIDEELHPGDIIVATNLAGRGTNIKLSKQVNDNGGLFVILSFLSVNTRVELQAFGRTARKGKPGSAQVIMSTEHLPQSFRNVSSLEEAKSTRDRLAAEKINDMMNDITELKLREDLFSEYCKTLEDIHQSTDGDEKRAVVSIMNEFWGIWLQTKSEEIDQLKRNELQTSLKEDLEKARSQSRSQTSPSSSIYHYIKFGNVALSEKKWEVSTKLFEKAMKLDENWAAIAFYNHAYCIIKQQNADYLTKAIDDLRKAQDSLKYLSEESIACLQLVKMSSADSADSDQTSLEKQLTNRCSMLGYFDKNINEAIQKLDEIEGRGRDAEAKKSPIFSLVSKADEDLQEEANNLYSQGLKYVFSVEEKPRFSWEGLLVFFLGVLQIIGGALLTAFTFGTLAQVGMGLITEGISDCISGIEAMVTGEFSWKSWAIEKSISIGLSLIGFGVGKLISKGFKASKMAIKGFGKQLKSMPKFLSRQTKDGFSTVIKTNMKNAVKLTAKGMVEEVALYGFGKAEERLLTEILDNIKNEAKKTVVDDVRSNMEKESLASLVDSVILSHLQDENQLQDLLQDKKRKDKLLNIFKKLSKTAVQPFTEDLSWQNKLNSSISTVMNKAKAEAKGKLKVILTVIQISHMSVLARDAIIAVHNLSSTFFLNLHEQLNKFKEENGFSEKVKVTELSASDTETLKEFKQDLSDTISTLLADALVEVFHQKFSSHIVSRVQNKVNGAIRRKLRTGLKSDRTEEKLKAGQNNRYITYMPGDPKRAGAAGELSRSHAEKIKNPETAGTVLDIRVLSETTGTKVVILTEDSHGRLTKMQQVSPGTGPTNQTVTLIYRPKSAQYPDGHYDVQINNKTVRINSEDKNCLFHAMARGRKPEASEEEIVKEAARLRSVEADALLTQAGQWEPFIKRKEWTEKIRGGDWYMTEGAGGTEIKKIKESKKRLQQEVGKIERYKEWQKYARKKENKGVGQFINADHQPPVKSILEARQRNQNSKLAEAMLEVATNTSPLDPNKIPNVDKYHGRELLTVYVPKETHREFPSTLSKAFRTLLAKTIASDKVVDTFKQTILGAMPRFRLNNNKDSNTKKNKMIATRLRVFENSFEEHSKKMVDEWFNLLQPKGVMTAKDRDTIKDWINREGYNDQNDPNWKKVSDLL